MNNLKFNLTTIILILNSNICYAADNTTTPDDENIHYVRVCDTYGKGYFTIPGTESCLALNGYVRFLMQGGHDPYDNSSYHSPVSQTRFHLSPKIATETEFGTLKTEATIRFQWGDGKDSKSSGTLRKAVISLGGLQIGLANSAFVDFSDYLGNIINDDVIAYGGARTNFISYTYKNAGGFSAILSLEQGNNSDSGFKTIKDDDNSLTYGGVITGYMPHIVTGAKYEQGWGSIALVTAYDSINKSWAGKTKLNLKANDSLSFWVQGAYKNNEDIYFDGLRQKTSFYGQWGGKWAIWGGSAYKLNDKTSLNIQLAYDASKTFATSANFEYQLVRGLIIQPEISYTRWNDPLATKLYKQDAIGGTVLIQRSF
ncbi:porin [Pseudochrobactrum sp. HB0163]|uniref:porin n=1 Tax=Pseudochrobactrum sp. HB0163 TaxID=3450708 RepID=UPI003F6E13E7